MAESKLDQTLRSQAFGCEQPEDQDLLRQVKEQAAAYATLANAIVVISDFLHNRCYIYAGLIGSVFSLPSYCEQATAFEECLFHRFHPEDELMRQQLELAYFHIQQTVPAAVRYQIHTACSIRIKDQNNQYKRLHYEVHYKAFHNTNSVWLAVCFYSLLPTIAYIEKPIVMNSQSGEMIFELTNECPNQSSLSCLLSSREIEILQLAAQGLASKQIATRLCIATNTVHRHRQNILKKLQVPNITSALQSAIVLGII